MKKKIAPARWFSELAFGARLTISGGPGSWVRLSLTAIGIALGVILLLAAGSIENVFEAHQDRLYARSTNMVFGKQQNQPLLGYKPSKKYTKAHALLWTYDHDHFRGQNIDGAIVWGNHKTRPVPPGVKKLPGPGEIVVSPHLKEALTSPEGKLLRKRMPEKIVGTISDVGLHGPREYYYYKGGSSPPAQWKGSTVERVTGFGYKHVEATHPILQLVIVITVVVFLLPILLFISCAVRFGDQNRDRRLSALRLVGVDRMMSRRIAAGEALLASVLGLILGFGLFYILRSLVEHVDIGRHGLFAVDVKPNLTIAFVVAAVVPIMAVLVTLFSLHRVMVEPLKVVQKAVSKRRKLWWRLLLPLAGILLLIPLLEGSTTTFNHRDYYVVATGTILLLIGVAIILPWVVERFVQRMGGRGRIAWLLAVRRLQLNNAMSARIVAGVAVAIAGAIGLQIFVESLNKNGEFAGRKYTGRPDNVVTIPDSNGTNPDKYAQRFRSIPGVKVNARFVSYPIHNVDRKYAHDPYTVNPLSTPYQGRSRLYVGSCSAVTYILKTKECNSDRFYVARNPSFDDYIPRESEKAMQYMYGNKVALASRDSNGSSTTKQDWQLPKAITSVNADLFLGRTSIYPAPIFASPKKLAHSDIGNGDTLLLVTVNRNHPDSLDLVRNMAHNIHPASQVNAPDKSIQTTTMVSFSKIKRGVMVSAVGLLMLIGASIILTVLEQLRESRRIIAVMGAFGVRKRILSISMLLQTTIPMVIGVILACVVGLGLGYLLTRIGHQKFRLDWVLISEIAGAGAIAIEVVSLLGLPLLWRFMRPTGLRSE